MKVKKFENNPRLASSIRQNINKLYEAGQETQNKFLISLRKIKKKDKEVMVCLDQSVEESKKWMKFSDFIRDVQAIQQKQKDLENSEGAKLSDKDKKRLCDYETFI